MNVKLIKKELMYEDIQIGDTDSFTKKLLSMILYNLPDLLVILIRYTLIQSMRRRHLLKKELPMAFYQVVLFLLYLE